MKYALILLAILGVYLWVTPAHTTIAENLRSAAFTIESVAASGSEPLKAHIRTGIGTVREKAMELLREQLHQSVDQLVK